MPIHTAQFAVGGTAVMIAGPDSMGRPVWVNCQHTAADPSHVLYLGGASVGTANGFECPADAVWNGYLGPDDSLYAITGGSEDILSVLIVRQD